MPSEGLNKVQLLGNLGADPELKYGESGAAVLRMRMAATEKWVSRDGERKERTEWMTVVFFGKRAEGLSKVLSKGEGVYVEGRLQTRQWEDRDGNKRYTTEVIGTQLLFLGGRGGGSDATRSDGGHSRRTGDPAADAYPTRAGNDFPTTEFGDDDIPF